MYLKIENISRWTQLDTSNNSYLDVELLLDGGKWKCCRWALDPDLSPASMGLRRLYVEELL